MKSAICNLNLRDLATSGRADKLIVAISRVKSGLKGPGVGRASPGRGHGKVNSGALMRAKPQCWFGVEG